VGGALGIAVLVMLVGTSAGAADSVARFHHLWLFATATALLSGALGALIPPPAARKAQGTRVVSQAWLDADSRLRS
jgi:hypothetical protein